MVPQNGVYIQLSMEKHSVRYYEAEFYVPQRDKDPLGKNNTMSSAIIIMDVYS